MTLLACASVKGSPGGTTTALAIAAALRGHAGVLVADCDPSGGEIAGRLGCAPEPGIVGLAAATRDGASDGLAIYPFTQGLASGVRVLPSPAGGSQPAAALAAMAAVPEHPVALAARQAGLVVVADVGRLGPGSAARPVAAAADLLAVVVRPELVDIAHLVDAMPRLRGITAKLGVVIVGHGRYNPGEVGAAADAPVLGELPFDRAGARLIASAVAGHWGASRTRLARAAYPLAARMLAATPGDVALRQRGRGRRARIAAAASRDRS